MKSLRTASAGHTFTPLLTSLGLDGDEAVVYEALLTQGPKTARELSTLTPLSRTLLYHILERLVEKKMVIKDEAKQKVALFNATHPKELEAVAEERKRSAEQTLAQLRTTLPDMSSLFNLGSGKPNVQFFEGMEGIKRVLEDSLSAQSEILCFLDIESIWEYIPDLNRDYAKRRLAKGIKKRNISADTQQNRFYTEGYYPTITRERLVPMPDNRTKTVVHMYDNKVSYFTLGVEPVVSVIISDPHIYAMNASLFEALWNHPQAYIPEHQREQLEKERSKTMLARA